LIGALKDADDQVRWEAAKALSDIRDPTAAPALVTALEDDLFGVRWLAAEGLTTLEDDGLRVLLPALIHNADSAVLRHGAHHVLRALSNRRWRALVMPVVTALESANASLAVPLAAYRAMAELEEQGHQETRP
jgi:HEAT repeat protein